MGAATPNLLLRDDVDDGDDDEEEEEEDVRALRSPVPPKRTMEEPRPRREDMAASYSSSLQRKFR